jgi:DNA-binding transcriptional MerR regulator
MAESSSIWPVYRGRRLAAIEAVISTRSVVVAAKVCGVPARTLRRWLSEEPFRRAVDQAARRVFADALRRVQVAAGEAVEVLRKLLRSRREDLRLSAARAILTAASESHATLGVETRLDEIEARITSYEQQKLKTA